MELSLNADNSLGSGWKYFYYDFCTRFSFAAKNLPKSKMYNGIGVRYYKSERAAYKDRMSIYFILFGLRIN